MNNFNDYKNFVALYNKKILILNDQFRFINFAKSSSRNTTQLTNEEKMEVLRHLSAKKNIGNADAGDFEDVLDIVFKDKKELISYIQEIYVTTNTPATKQHIKQLLEDLYDKAVYDSHVSLKPNSNPTLSTSWKFPYKGNASHIEQILEKLYRTREFFVQKSLQIDNFPTTKVELKDVYGFDQLSFNELQAMFAPSNFYKLDAEQIPYLSQALVNKYLEANNVETCKVDAVNMPSSKDSIIYGAYLPNLGVININKRYFTNFDAAKSGLNPVLPLKLMSTLLHEAQHRVQFANLDKDNLSAREELVKQSILRPTCKDYLENENAIANSYAEYLSEPDEVDARNAALDAIAYMINGNPYVSDPTDKNRIAAFFNVIHNKEVSNAKLNYKPEYKELFKQVYKAKNYALKNDHSTTLEILKSQEQLSSIFTYQTMDPYYDSLY